ncbi:MAG: endolytic transglycosylase MltG [Pseudomonadota bacterium]
MTRHVAANGLTILMAALVALMAAVHWGKSQFSEPGPLAEAICLRVESGANMRRLADRMEDAETITNARIFRMGANFTDRAEDLKAGSFLVPAEASMAAILETITRGGQSTCGSEIVYRIGVVAREVSVRELDPASGRYVERAAFVPGEEEPPAAYLDAREAGDMRYRVVVAEGSTRWQVAQSLMDVEFLEGGIDALPAEGALAPDSYEVAPGSSRTDLISRMERLQEDRLATAWEARDPALPIESPRDLLTLASIVEKETGLAVERRQVASVFVNRLRRGMLLQTDPTVIYGITEGRAPLGRGLRRSELDRPTPFNTYVVAGLPPTPIANPGRLALEAAANPDETPYIFFVADGTGGHAFAETLLEHEANVAEWRRIERARNSGQ